MEFSDLELIESMYRTSERARRQAAPDRQRTEYIALRDQYKPVSVKHVVVAESPPASGLYFYKPGRRNEPLFAALVKLIGLDRSEVSNKEDGLREFQRRGWILVDATYQPVDQLSDAGADRIIIRDYPLLLAELVQLTPELKPRLLLLDEPTAGMGDQETYEITQLVRRLHKDGNLTIVLIEHDMRVVFHLADRITVLDQGSFLAEGTPQEIATNDAVQTAYLGKAA